MIRMALHGDDSCEDYKLYHAVSDIIGQQFNFSDQHGQEMLRSFVSEEDWTIQEERNETHHQVGLFPSSGLSVPLRKLFGFYKA